jgi:hypothetical protein
MAKKKELWFQPEKWKSKPLGWRKDDTQEKRRHIAMRNRGNNPLKAARALQALANVNKGKNGDTETRRKAQLDADYFYKLNREKNK